MCVGWPGYAALVLYFVLSASATRIGWRRKRELGIAEASGGARGAKQVVANGGPAVLFGLLAAGLPAGWGGVAATAFVGSLAAAAADTVSSEVGKWWGGPTRRLPDLAAAAPGSPGGVSAAGSLAGLLASLAVAGASAVGGLLVPATLLLPVAGTGFLAAFLEGLLAPLEARGTLDNDGVNALSVLAGGCLAAAASWFAAVAGGLAG